MFISGISFFTKSAQMLMMKSEYHSASTTHANLEKEKNMLLEDHQITIREEIMSAFRLGRAKQF